MDGGEAGVTRIKFSIQPKEISGNSVTPMGHSAECYSVLFKQSTVGQRSALSPFTSTVTVKIFFWFLYVMCFMFP